MWQSYFDFDVVSLLRLIYMQKWLDSGSVISEGSSNVDVLTILPLSGSWVDDSEELIIGDGLGVEVYSCRLLLHVLIGLEQ